MSDQPASPFCAACGLRPKPADAREHEGSVYHAFHLPKPKVVQPPPVPAADDVLPARDDAAALEAFNDWRCPPNEPYEHRAAFLAGWQACARRDADALALLAEARTLLNEAGDALIMTGDGHREEIARPVLRRIDALLPRLDAEAGEG